MNNKSKNNGNKTYSYKTRTDKIQLRIIDGIDEDKVQQGGKNLSYYSTGTNSVKYIDYDNHNP